MQSVWAYPAGIGYQGQEQAALTGFTLTAPDGIVGQVERQVDEAGMQHLVVDTGVWVFGKSVLIPAGIVVAIDTGAQNGDPGPGRGQRPSSEPEPTPAQVRRHRETAVPSSWPHRTSCT
ncbi:PRC-barrel domain containing protein [Streptomyces sp. NPDC058297]|uniref:PRC-barrel domain containing protein n=1 Tax=Streptomyces sp. NPDC058297 TaxID=3346433 RepID=UPI0036E79F20